MAERRNPRQARTSVGMPWVLRTLGSPVILSIGEALYPLGRGQNSDLNREEFNIPSPRQDLGFFFPRESPPMPVAGEV